jgi:membrane peptidoglycan carboxypeptidase
MLAGFAQGASAYDPVLPLRRARERQPHVPDQLATNHFLTARVAAVAYRVRLVLPSC